ARDAFREIQTFLRDQAKLNLDMRALSDIYPPQRPVFFISFPGGGRCDKLMYVVDPLSAPDVSPEQVALYSYSETEGGIWTSFHLADDYKQGGDLNAHDNPVFALNRHAMCV